MMNKREAMTLDYALGRMEMVLHNLQLFTDCLDKDIRDATADGMSQEDKIVSQYVLASRLRGMYAPVLDLTIINISDLIDEAYREIKEALA